MGHQGHVHPLSTPRQTRHRHRFYRHLLIICLLIMVSFGLPQSTGTRFLVTAGYVVLIFMLGIELRSLFGSKTRHNPTDLLYLALSGICILAQALWFATPVSLRLSGLPLLLVLSLFIGWSLIRLVNCLAAETLVTRSVVAGALAGYLLLGISGGLAFSVLETMQPGSFLATDDQTPEALEIAMPQSVNSAVWARDFIHINYFAFVSLTTVGYGDIIPVRSAAQISSIGLSILGPLYTAVVMGLLISRLTQGQGGGGTPPDI